MRSILANRVTSDAQDHVVVGIGSPEAVRRDDEIVNNVAMLGPCLYSPGMDVIALSAPTGMIKQIISMSKTDTEIIRLPAEPGDR